jgi:hypothetical protein
VKALPKVRERPKKRGKKSGHPITKKKQKRAALSEGENPLELPVVGGKVA